MIYPVLPQDIPSVWEGACDQLAAAFELSSVDDAKNHLFDLFNDREQLWSIHDQAWAITRVVQGKTDRILEIVAMSGSGIAQWNVEFFDRVESWGKANGCTQSVFTGRVGWVKKAPGYKQKRITFVKEL